MSGDETREARREIEETETTAEELGRAANLFDVRRVIGGLFTLYGVILTVVGLTASSADKAKSLGVNLSLWTGLGMLAVGLFFLAWSFVRPLSAELADSSQGAAA